MNINDYKKEFCNNNKAEFARAFGRLPQNVTKLFNEPKKWMVVRDPGVDLLVQIRGSRNN